MGPDGQVRIAPCTRRDWLRWGGSTLAVGAATASWSPLGPANGIGNGAAAHAAEAGSHDNLQRRPPRAESLIILFLNGGPSHLDMWDLKPEGPAESRGEFQPIDTTLTG